MWRRASGKWYGKGGREKSRHVCPWKTRLSNVSLFSEELKFESVRSLFQALHLCCPSPSERTTHILSCQNICFGILCHKRMSYNSNWYYVFCLALWFHCCCSVMSDSSTPWTAAHQASLSPRACSDFCQLSQWCHPPISTSVSPSSSCPQSFPTSRFLPVSWLFASGSQSIGASSSASVLPMKIQG